MFCNELFKTVLGTVSSINSSVINIYPVKSKPLYDYDEVIWHESGHVYDNRHIRLYSVSKSLKWWRAIRKDTKYLKKQGYASSYEGFVSVYAKSEYDRNKLLFYRRYAEDFAESVRMYINNERIFRTYYPNRYKVLKEIFG